jgi:molecular chaperone GrpE
MSHDDPEPTPEEHLDTAGEPDARHDASQEPEGLAFADGAGEAPEDDPVALVAKERDDYLDALRRKQAEFENFRKRMMREGATQRIAGHAEVAERMLDVLDDFDRTIEAAGDVDPGFLKGVQLVHDKLARVLADFGLQRIADTGVAFDPNRHEAVQQVPAEEGADEPRVAAVLRPGYELGERVLRAAMVVVAQ